MSTPKVAILLCGYFRSWNQCLPSFLNFTSGLDYDVFIHTYSMVKAYHPYIRDSLGITNNTITEPHSQIRDNIKIPYKKLVIEDGNESLPEVKTVENISLSCYQVPSLSHYDDLQVLKGKGISIRTYLQYRKFRICNDLRKQYEKESGVSYDFVVKLRMDLDYTPVLTPLSLLLSFVTSNNILTSSSNNQPNDHIYISIPSNIDKLLISLGSCSLPLDREYNSHEHLYKSLIQSHLTFFPCIHNLYVKRVLSK